MTPQITKVEGLKRGMLIKRPDGDVSLKPGLKEGHTQFRIKFRNELWTISEKGIVCICVEPVKDNWTGFKIKTLPPKGFYCHVEPVYA